MAEEQQNLKWEEMVLIRLLFLGRFDGGVNSKEKQIWRWYKLGDIPNDGQPLKYNFDNEVHYTKKNVIKSARPGTIVEVPKHPTERFIYPTRAKIIGSWENEEDVIRWNIEHREVEMAITARSKSVQDLLQHLPTTVLEPFREAYWNAQPKQRANLLAFVIYEITRFSNSKKLTQSDSDD